MNFRSGKIGLTLQNQVKSAFVRGGSKYVIVENLFWTPGLPDRVLCNRPCKWFICSGLSVFEYCRDWLLLFSEILHEVVGNEVKEATQPELKKKS